MMLPSTLKMNTEWVFIGPMGPMLPTSFETLPSIGVDGGAHFAKKLDIWVGDADSYDKEIEAPTIFRHPVEKDLSDLALGLTLFPEQRLYKFHFWGFLGGRRDHELFNLGEASKFLEEHQECQILFYGEDGKIYFHMVGSGHWKFSYDGLFSLGTLKKTLVRLIGDCHYPIQKFQKLEPLTSFGLSNKGRGEMIFETEGPVFLYFPEGK